MKKDIFTVLDELATANRKRDIRLLKAEKELYSRWRSGKLTAIEHAKFCKKLGLPELQKRWENQIVKYDHWAKESKAYIRQIGAEIYGKEDA